MVALLRSVLQRNLPMELWRREVWAHVVISQPANIVATACDRTGNIQDRFCGIYPRIVVMTQRKNVFWALGMQRGRVLP